MIVNYQKVPKEARDNVRIVNDKGHAPYIIYLLLKRFDLKEIPDELSKIHLSQVGLEQLKDFLEYALYPLIQESGLEKYFKKYVKVGNDTTLSISSTFARSDSDRQNFIVNIVVPTGADVFFSDEVKRFYRGMIPRSENGRPIIKDYGEGWMNILTHEKRFVIDGFLAEGRNIEELIKHFESVHHENLSKNDLKSYSAGFMNAPLHQMSKAIIKLENELNEITKATNTIKNNKEKTIGEKSVIIAQLNKKEKYIRAKLEKMKSLHNSGAFATATLEYINMRDILADVLQRTHRRFIWMDERTDDDVIVSLSRLSNTIDKTINRILMVDEVASGVETKTVTEEMIDVIKPTLDRLEEEEREAIQGWHNILGMNNPDGEMDDIEDTKTTEKEIIGFD